MSYTCSCGQFYIKVTPQFTVQIGEGYTLYWRTCDWATFITNYDDTKAQWLGINNRCLNCFTEVKI